MNFTVSESCPRVRNYQRELASWYKHRISICYQWYSSAHKKYIYGHLKCNVLQYQIIQNLWDPSIHQTASHHGNITLTNTTTKSTLIVNGENSGIIEFDLNYSIYFKTKYWETVCIRFRIRRWKMEEISAFNDRMWKFANLRASVCEHSFIAHFAYSWRD